MKEIGRLSAHKEDRLERPLLLRWHLMTVRLASLHDFHFTGDWLSTINDIYFTMKRSGVGIGALNKAKARYANNVCLAGNDGSQAR